MDFPPLGGYNPYYPDIPLNDAPLKVSEAEKNHPPSKPGKGYNDRGGWYRAKTRQRRIQ